MKNKELSLYTNLKLLFTLASIYFLSTACAPTSASLAAEPNYTSQSRITICTSDDPTTPCLGENGIPNIIINATESDGDDATIPTDSNGQVFLPFPEYTNWTIDEISLSLSGYCVVSYLALDTGIETQNAIDIIVAPCPN